MSNRKTKFSGEKDSYDTGATRDKAKGKGAYELISPLALKRLADVYERGARNHGDRNWELGIPFSRLMQSSLRHLNQYLFGMRDEDHLGQAAWNIFALMHFEEQSRDDLNDLPYYYIYSEHFPVDKSKLTDDTPPIRLRCSYCLQDAEGCRCLY